MRRAYNLADIESATSNVAILKISARVPMPPLNGFNVPVPEKERESSPTPTPWCGAKRSRPKNPSTQLISCEDLCASCCCTHLMQRRSGLFSSRQRCALMPRMRTEV